VVMTIYTKPLRSKHVRQAVVSTDVLVYAMHKEHQCFGLLWVLSREP
jgi:hypothetical protein